MNEVYPDSKKQVDSLQEYRIFAAILLSVLFVLQLVVLGLTLDLKQRTKELEKSVDRLSSGCVSDGQWPQNSKLILAEALLTQAYESGRSSVTCEGSSDSH